MLHSTVKNTVPDLIRNCIKYIHPLEATFMKVKRGDSYINISYKETIQNMDAISSFLLDNKIAKGDAVGLIIENSPEYVFFDQGLQQIAAINVSIYPTLSENDLAYILNDSSIKVLLVGSHFLLKKILKILPTCPQLIQLVCAFNDYSKYSSTYNGNVKINSLDEIIKMGNKSLSKNASRIELLREELSPEDLSSLIYTSGTTGTPKGVMLTHKNFVCNAIHCLQHIPVITEKETFLSFLPLSHVFEKTATYHVCLVKGCTMAFAQSLDLLGNNMMEVRPTIMAAVPRLLERIHDKAIKKATSGGKLKQTIFFWAIGIGEKARKLKEEKKSLGLLLFLKLKIAERLVFSKIKAKTGGRIKFILSGGGALPQNIGEFFGNLGIKVMEGYGLTETSPVVAVNQYHEQFYGTVGKIIPGVEIGLQNPETKEIITVQTPESFNPTYESVEGEIIIKGHCIMKGYYKKPEETAMVIDSEGWFHTGDIGKFYGGHLKITDRIKNIIVNSFGKNIYPTPIENTYLKSQKIESVFLIGDKREHLTAIIVPNQEVMMEDFKLDLNFFENKDAFIRDQNIHEWINVDMQQFAKDLSKFERVKNFIVKRNPFSIDEGELTPTMKPRRKAIEKIYENEIDGMYVD